MAHRVMKDPAEKKVYLREAARRIREAEPEVRHIHRAVFRHPRLATAAGLAVPAAALGALGGAMVRTKKKEKKAAAGMYRKAVMETLRRMGRDVADPATREVFKRGAGAGAAGTAGAYGLYKVTKGKKDEPTTITIAKHSSAPVMVSRVPKVRKRQLEALKSRGIEGPTKTAEELTPAEKKRLLGAAEDVRSGLTGAILGGGIGAVGYGRPGLGAGVGGAAGVAGSRLADLIWSAVEKRKGKTKKSSVMSKEAIGPWGLLGAGLLAPGAVSESKKRLAAAKGTGGAVMTPAQMQALSMQMEARRAQMGAR
jgi:hypothetical protein